LAVNKDRFPSLFAGLVQGVADQLGPNLHVPVGGEDDQRSQRQRPVRPGNSGQHHVSNDVSIKFGDEGKRVGRQCNESLRQARAVRDITEALEPRNGRQIAADG
jgi:hypothetical protein